jgi:hypothetical protein
MLKETTVKIPEEATRTSETSSQIDAVDDCPREPFEVVDDPGSEEEPDGYGHGV